MSAEMVNRPASGRGNQRDSPELGEEVSGQSRAADSAVEGAAQKMELDPGGDPSGDCKSGNAPARLDTKHAGQRKRAEIAERGGEDHADDGEPQRCARVAQRVVGGR